MTTAVQEEEDELQARLGIAPDRGVCGISGCENPFLDGRGSISMDAIDGQPFDVTVCTPHWESILSELGRQTHDDDGEYSELEITGMELLREEEGSPQREDSPMPEENYPTTIESRIERHERGYVVSWHDHTEE